ncbi:hypothetical protein [Nocardia alni]|uniref:hypothetical protein n=1 Tax=Nocardia alni TaxID=2815723 RepID=UPI001C21B5F5|nr:hypothetical protein [Nocardia alni]
MSAHPSGPGESRGGASAESGAVQPGVPPLGTFRERLDWARRTILPPGRNEPFSATEMADMIGRKIAFDGRPVAAEHAAGYALSKTYLADMLSGAKTNPTLDVMRTLGAFFHTGSAFFADHDGEYARRIAAQVGFVNAARDTEMYMFGARAGQPSSEALAQLGGQVMQWLLNNVGSVPIAVDQSSGESDVRPPA